MSGPRPNFLPLHRPFFTRYGTEEQYQLVPITDLEATPHHLERLQQICNEPAIYKWLFAPEIYSLEKAKGFLAWGKAGWQAHTHFVFLILDSHQQIAGAIDLKSAQLQAGEVGYWVSQDHSGLASSALACLIELAQKAGYTGLFAQVKAGNERSIKVLLRNGFFEAPEAKTNPQCAQAFRRELTPS